MSTQAIPEEKGEVVALPAIRSKSNGSHSMPVTAGFFDLQSFELMQRVAKGFSASTLVPKTYQGGTVEAIGNCMIALNLAKRIGADPLMVMQNLNVVQGRPAWSSQFLIASVNTCGRFSALRFEFFGTKGQDDYGCRARAVEKATGEMLTGADITIALAKKEGWFGRTGSKWQSMTQQMLMYRAGAWWTKVYAPELSMGLMTAEEADDVIDLVAQSSDAGTYSAAVKEPRSISSRLDQFAEVDVEHDPVSPDADDAPSSVTTEASPHPEASEVPASFDAVPLAAEDDAGAQVMPEHIAQAMEQGRLARRSGYKREVPKPLAYTKKKPEADAFLLGWDEENYEINAVEHGTV